MRTGRGSLPFWTLRVALGAFVLGAAWLTAASLAATRAYLVAPLCSQLR